jgi:hypothetical protein
MFIQFSLNASVYSNLSLTEIEDRIRLNISKYCGYVGFKSSMLRMAQDNVYIHEDLVSAIRAMSCYDISMAINR